MGKTITIDMKALCLELDPTMDSDTELIYEFTARRFYRHGTPYPPVDYLVPLTTLYPSTSLTPDPRTN